MRGWGPILGPIILAFLLAIWPGWLAARPAPSINIATAIDVSDSINEEDFLLEMEGLARGVTDERFLAHLGDGVGFEVFTWSSLGVFDTLIPYTVIRSPSDAAMIAARLRAEPFAGLERYPPINYGPGRRSRNSRKGYTDLSAAIDEGVVRLVSRLVGRRVLNVLTDGRDNVGEAPAPARNRAAALGITINAVLFGGGVQHEAYYHADVVTGPGAFVLIAGSSAELPVTLQRKFWQDMIALEGG